MGLRVDGRLLHHLRFAGNIVLITPSISQAKRMLVRCRVWIVFGLLLGTKFTGILSVLYYFSYLDGLTGGGDAVIDENGTAFTQTKEFQIWEAA
ncbi:hypothetical protein Y032_0005g2292 [Ancylostoma ceylanicum]|uniref:Reverse transcriptase domain-containing protein n=1 Tax=Ancylostoma ceylanicum TaxID=53326 RepID=A0A016VSU8_9BILA|nr:hypothetical protein Y032_0005g2292 [Ancylostoma ceylanicum]